MNSLPRIAYYPTDADIISSLLTGVLGYWFEKSTFVRGTLTQFVIIQLAKNISSATNVLDRQPNELFQEIDLWAMIIRGLITGGLIYQRENEIKWNDTELLFWLLTSPGTIILARLLTEPVVFN